MIVRRLVFGLGFRYRPNFPGLPGKPDLVFLGKKKIIFVHGCFWHQHECKSRDAETLIKLQLHGWRVLVIWECQLRRTKVLRIAAVEVLGG